MIKDYLQYLKKLYLELDDIKNEVSLSEEVWNQNSYRKLSDLVYEKLEDKFSDKQKQKYGTTLSDRTLYNIFEGKRVIKTPLDKRALNTLDKLAYFADIKGWNALVKKYESSVNKAKGKKGEVEKIKHLIMKAKEAEYHSFLSLPEIAPNGLSNYFTEESSAYSEIISLLEEFSQKEMIISNNYNPSSYEILSMDIEKSELKENNYIVATEEYWIFCWYDVESKKYKLRDKRLQKHKYVVEYNDDKKKWLINVNASN